MVRFATARFTNGIIAAVFGLLVLVVPNRLWAQLNDPSHSLQLGDPGQQTQATPLAQESTFYEATTRSRVTQNFEIYNPHSEEQLKALKEMGFTQVILDWPNLHEAASNVGLNIVLANWWTPKTEFETLEKGMAHAKLVDPQRLVAISMMDEPERNSPETPLTYYEELYYDLRSRLDRELPHVKLEISHWGPLRSWSREQYATFIPLYRGTDRVRLMPYPDLSEGPLDEVFLQMMRSRQLMKLAGREVPQVVILQTWVLPEDPKLPTIDELRVMAYQAILCGAETLSFFSYDPMLWDQTAGFTTAFAALMRELTAFAHRYRDATVEAQMSPDGILAAELRLPSGRSVSVTINTNRDPTRNLAALEVQILESDSTVVGLNPTSCTTKSRLMLRRRIFRERFWR